MDIHRSNGFFTTKFIYGEKSKQSTDIWVKIRKAFKPSFCTDNYDNAIPKWMMHSWTRRVSTTDYHQLIVINLTDTGGSAISIVLLTAPCIHVQQTQNQNVQSKVNHFLEPAHERLLLLRAFRRDLVENQMMTKDADSVQGLQLHNKIQFVHEKHN